MNEPIPALVQELRQGYEEGATRELGRRVARLRALHDAIQAAEPRILAALRADLNKTEYEAYLSEVSSLLAEIRFVVKRMKRWSRPKRVRTPATHIGSRSYVYSEPYGVALIIAPWNYPFQLAIAPLIGAIAAGNCAVVKPSELTPATAAVIREVVEGCLNDGTVRVVLGGIETAQALLAERFDCIFYTGSTAVGRQVMEAAARHLTPVTLELGGKSPCIVHADAKLEVAAMRIAWAKFFNAGQTCVAPDYVYVHRSVREPFIEALVRAIETMHRKRIEQGEFTHIVNERHYDRLQRYLGQGKLLHGGEGNRDTLLLEPTLLGEVNLEDEVMQEEIFGPILPILVYDELGEAIREIARRPKPLALYLFAESADVQRQVLQRLSFGGGCVNDAMFHLATPYLPFGGVGDSGMGAYHGRASFEAFSHRKSVLRQSTAFDMPLRYPHHKRALSFLRRFYK
ncbi:aldehyde dehydrogenase [Paenibacillus sp. IB182496]|uniref:Aldehyde dehydrogenase n=1 Tax=Paenibacillus sabuli TaxID=2772509 RepID=A0A927BU62_9BACL|nr:aldehyde dehydrogenase [Paenibacillus sabuli]MBD2846881.1 aldehyde dehydrogenase [Paenibacillus sabuli]